MSEAGMRRTRELRALSRKLLVEGDVAVIIGYRDGVWQNTTRPCFATSPEATQHLVWNHHCVNNLTVYLTRPEIRRLGRPAVVVKGCDSRALDVLAREHQIARDDVVVVGMVCDGVIDSRHGVDGTRLLPKCERCTVATPPRVDHLVGDPGPARAQLPPDRSALDRIEALWTALSEVLRLPSRLSTVLLRTVLRRADPAGVDLVQPDSQGKLRLPPVSSVSPRRPVRRVWRVRARVPTRHSARSVEPEDGRGGRRFVRLRCRRGSRGRRAAPDIHAR
jgi:hypothetical protein